MKANRNIAGMIFDLTIPGGMGGKETIEEIRKICTDTPIFVSSGYSADPIIAHPGEYGFTASISKPFMMSELSAMLEKHMKAGDKDC
jgi:CheY-like chemotaxis protein